MKKISVIVPMYYEEEVTKECYLRLRNVLEKIENYDYEIIFIDNDSKDKTRELIEKQCNSNKKVKAIFNARNYNGTLNIENILIDILKNRSH